MKVQLEELLENLKQKQEKERQFAIKQKNNIDINSKYEIDYTYGYQPATSAYIPLPPFEIINAFYLTNLPPPLNYVNKFDQEEKRMNDRLIKAEKLQKELEDEERGIYKSSDQRDQEQEEINYSDTEIVSISFVDRNGYADIVNSYFDPKIYFGGHPAIVCEFYAPIIKVETAQNALVKFALEV
ncbi:MAG: hypothetical protein EZS28_013451 [Streblomastix strix]|uniref:Uncharacterized protein n=1 Tax=Streblomastix strix TaxID=222440 RepID=A0A5J4W830_9EUKA|nr:MAG: hypothetical protein EZS28_013451 [Streblomastix strix]